MKQQFTILMLVILLQSCAVLKNDSQKNRISIVQNNKEVKIKNLKTISLEKKQFSFRFNVKKNTFPITQENFNYARVAFFTNKKAFLNVGNEKEGEYHCFNIGMSRAHGEEIYESIFINTSKNGYIGHSSLYYKEKNKKTVRLISSENGYDILEFPIKIIANNEKEFLIENINLTTIYTVFFFDNNRDNKIDKNELIKFTLKFDN